MPPCSRPREWRGREQHPPAQQRRERPLAERVYPDSHGETHDDGSSRLRQQRETILAGAALRPAGRGAAARGSSPCTTDAPDARPNRRAVHIDGAGVRGRRPHSAAVRGVRVWRWSDDGQRRRRRPRCPHPANLDELKCRSRRGDADLDLGPGTRRSLPRVRLSRPAPSCSTQRSGTSSSQLASIISTPGCAPEGVSRACRHAGARCTQRTDRVCPQLWITPPNPRLSADSGASACGWAVEEPVDNYTVVTTTCSALTRRHALDVEFFMYRAGPPDRCN